MKFDQALKTIKAGGKVKLPSWGGYWYWDSGKETVIMHTKDGVELDIRETQAVEYTLLNILSEEWQIADETNCPELGGEATFSFGEAIKYLKRGMKVARKGWNGKGMFLLYVPSEKWGIIEKIGLGIPKGNLLPWIGMKTADGKFIPWLASQADMLVDDWVFFE